MNMEGEIEQALSVRFEIAVSVLSAISKCNPNDGHSNMLESISKF